MPAMPDDDTAQDPLKESQSAQLISDPELQRLLEIIAKRMGLPPESALRRSLETILVMYQSAVQGGQPIIRYPSSRTEQQIYLPGVAPGVA